MDLYLHKEKTMSNENPFETPQSELSTDDVLAFDETSPFSPKGRFGRAHYIAYIFGLYLAMGLLVGLVAGISATAGGEGAGAIISMIVMGIGYIAIFIFGVIFMIRRLHDINWSGWFSILAFIPIVNIIITIPALFFRGTKGSNKFGPPRKRGRATVIAALLFLVVFVGGILAAVAIPAYQDYVQRAQAAAIQ
jgi:uncharacterized membrane protein YhaH (DUF805 family)